jgi:hypothetical protein
MRDYSPRCEPFGSGIRLIFSIAFTTTLLVATSSISFAQSSNVKFPAIKSHPSVESISPVEDVYFNADSKEVSAASTLAANQMSANSIGRVLTLLFDAATVSLQSPNDPMAATWSGTITVPINAGAKPKAKSFVQDIRGSVIKTPDTRVVIILDLGGKNFVADFPYGMKHNGNIRKRFVSVKNAQSPRYTASITIFAERRSAKGSLLVGIDGLDIEAR